MGVEVRAQIHERSEFAAQQATASCLSPWVKHFEGHVVTLSDLILVMGEDALNCLGFCIAITWAIQTKPWLMEIDLWKRFISIDIKALPRLASLLAGLGGV